MIADISIFFSCPSLSYFGNAIESILLKLKAKPHSSLSNTILSKKCMIWYSLFSSALACWSIICHGNNFTCEVVVDESFYCSCGNEPKQIELH